MTAIQLMPIQEFATEFSLGYNGVDYFSPEMDFAVEDEVLAPYVAQANALLQAKGQAPYEIDQLRGEMNQLKALIDLCHLHGLAVILDVVYNHAGGDFGDESIYFFDRQIFRGRELEFALFQRPRPRRRPRFRVRETGRARLSHPERQIFSRRISRRRIPL